MEEQKVTENLAQNQKTQAKRRRDYVDPIVFNGGPLNRANQRRVLEGEGFLIPTRKKKVKANDDGVADSKTIVGKAKKRGRPQRDSKDTAASVAKPKRKPKPSYNYVSADVYSPEQSSKHYLYKYMNTSFLDKEDNSIYLITDICECSEFPDVLFFEYIERAVYEDYTRKDEYHHTSVEEVLKWEWSSPVEDSD